MVSPPADGDHSSSSAPTDEREISSRLSSSSSSVTPSFFAISSSVGARWSSFSSAAIARSIWRARVRTERGTQSSERSSSMIAPRMRAIANVSNLISREGSNRSIAPMRPSRPYETRSCSSTCAGRLAPTRPATNFTSGAYVRISRSRSSWSFGLAVLLPERLGLIRSSHGKRIRRERAESSGATPNEGTAREVAHPQRERGRGQRDHPRAAAFKRRVDRDEGKPERERDEKEAEKAPLHRRKGSARESRGYTPRATQGRSSAGRALVSKTRGRRFDPCRPCWVCGYSASTCARTFARGT